MQYFLSKYSATLPVAIALLLLLGTTSSFATQRNAASLKPQRRWGRAQPSTTRTRYSSSSCSQLLMTNVVECDVVIVGGGPAGCTCALYTSRADLSTVIVDKNPAVGALAITSHIANYPGVDRSMSGAELLEQMKTQAVQYGTRYERAQVFMIDVDENTADSPYSKVVYTPDLTVKARALVLATGAMGRAAPPFPGEEKYLGQGVSYCATCDGAFYRDAEVAVFGATTEAMEEALFLTKFASTVHWVTSTDVAACLQQQGRKIECNNVLDQELLEELLGMENVKHWSKTRLISVEGDNNGVTGIKVQKVYMAEQEIIPVEGAFIYGAGGGSKPITDFVQNKVALDENGGAIVNGDMETSVKGVFAIGDIRNTAYKQVVVAAADGCIAAMSIEKFLKGRKTVKVDWIHK
jgi:thioredoxin reductase (NADPH)